jgi:hypothetical protein
MAEKYKVQADNYKQNSNAARTVLYSIRDKQITQWQKNFGLTGLSFFSKKKKKKKTVYKKEELSS